MQWDVFCRVVDNFGDIGVCWRLAADLACRGESVRLWVDDASALAWMAPTGAVGVTVHPWPDGKTGLPLPGEVVIEAFGCDLPAAWVTSMAACHPQPVWINLEYLSAEPYVGRSHGLRSPQLSGPGQGLEKWFHYPGFSAATGGLLREPGLGGSQLDFDAPQWLAQQGIASCLDESRMSLFCYPGFPVEVLNAWSNLPTHLLLAAGVEAPARLPAGVRTTRLPKLTQQNYDRLLWACDLNVVRGEDSFVRAQWAGRPFIWHIYPQADGAHAVKLQAFLDLYLDGAGPELALAVRRLWLGWNGLAAPAALLPDLTAWRAHGERWRDTLWASPDLVTGLIEFVAKAR